MIDASIVFDQLLRSVLTREELQQSKAAYGKARTNVTSILQQLAESRRKSFQLLLDVDFFECVARQWVKRLLVKQFSSLRKQLGDSLTACDIDKVKGMFEQVELPLDDLKKFSKTNAAKGVLQILRCTRKSEERFSPRLRL